MYKLLKYIIVLSVLALLLIEPYELSFKDKDLEASINYVSKVDKSVDQPLTAYDLTQIDCLSKNIYFEAAVESTAGKIAVAQVTTNRVKSERFPSSFCEVIKQGKHYKSGHPIKHMCQFSWYCDGKKDEPYDGQIWKNTYELAEWFYLNQENLPDITEGSLYYHADYVNPKWSRTKKKVLQIDTHIFYR